MVCRNTLKAAMLATVCLAPLAAFADSGVISVGNTHYEFEIGLMGVMGNNPDQAGRYDGHTTTGVDLVGQFAARSRPLWNSGETWYYNVTGDNLIFQTGTDLGSGVGSDSNYTSSTHNNLANNGSVNFNFGKQGTWEGSLYYDAISYTGNVIDSIYTVSGGLASLNPGLTPWGGATATIPGGVTKTSLKIGQPWNAAMLPLQTGTRRDILGGNFKYLYGDWTFSGAMRHDHKYGSMEESFDGPWGGTAFALPIDYTTDRYDAALAYTTPVNQLSLQYTFSHFHDDNSFVNLPYPYSYQACSPSPCVPVNTIPYQQSAAYSTPPSTSAHYLTLMAATNMVPKTRINLNLRGGLELQDDMFAPDTADPNPAGAPGLSNLNAYLQGTQGSSLNDVAKVVQGKVSVDTHPIANLDANAYYGFDGRWVSLDQYKVYTGTTGGAGDATFTNAQYVVPQEWQKQNAGVQASYRIIPKYDTKLTIGYRFDDVGRSNAQVGSSTTNTESVALSSTIGPQVFGRLSYDHADRSAVLSYLTPWANLAGSPTTTLVAYSGAYYQAPMTSDAVKLMADYSPRENLTGSLFLQFKNEDYTYPAATAVGGVTPPLTGVGTGIKQDYNLTVGPSIDYRPRDNLDLHFFYTYEQIFFNNLGNGNCATSNTGACLGSAGYYQNKYTSDVQTVGVSGDWQVTPKLKLGADESFAYGSVMFGEYNGVFVAAPTASYQNVSNYPDINSIMNNLRLTATYELMPHMDLLLQGTWSYFHDNDWNDTASSIQGAGSSTVSILTPGYSSPNYNVVTVLAGMKFDF